MNNELLSQIGVYGYEPVEPVVLAALVSGDPLLLVGRSGTGKTFLLNSLSEALELEHRHYNASLIAFDDLVGFPWPEEATGGIRYIQTPATVWGAQSVLIDEINRCKPEHQNRLFSLVHERRIQGLKLDRLEYRWAAMNPPGLDQSADGAGYTGCEPLDTALADRFAFVVKVADWQDLSLTDWKAIADPRGDGRISRDSCGLKDRIASGRKKFEVLIKDPTTLALEYARQVTDALLEAGVRLSPRRVRQLCRNLLALESVCVWPREQIYRLGLECSLPQQAAPCPPDPAVIAAAHRSAWSLCASDGEEKWLYEFHQKPDLPSKLAFLLETCQCPETGSLAISQFLASATYQDQVIFAFALFPALVKYPGSIVQDESLHDLGQIVTPMLQIDAGVAWRETNAGVASGKFAEKEVAGYSEIRRVLEERKGSRRHRASQLLLHLLIKHGPMAAPPLGQHASVYDWADDIEKTFHSCYLKVQRYYKSCHGNTAS